MPFSYYRGQEEERMNRQKIRFGVIGFAHLHVLELIRGFLQMPEQYEFIGAADTRPMIETDFSGRFSRNSNKALFQQMMGPDAVCASVEELLSGKPELILVTTENALHGTVVPELLLRGIHVVVDKPLAICEEHAAAIRKAEIEGGARCITNWFSYWKPGIRLARKLMREGIVGSVYRFQYRNPDTLGVYEGKAQMDESILKKEWWYQLRCGGGSMIDYCSYGIVLADWFLERQPEAVSAVTKNFHQKFCDAEDYAALTLLYPDTIAYLEGTWTTVSSGLPTGPILWGEKGTLIAENYDHSNSTRVCLYQTPHASAPDKIYHSEDYPLPECHRNLAEDVYYYLTTREPVPYLLSTECNQKAARILDAARKSAATGAEQKIRNSSAG